MSNANPAGVPAARGTTGTSGHSRGRPFDLGDHTFLTGIAEKMDLYAPLREAVQNAIDAGASMIDIYPSNDGSKIVIADNGKGMTKPRLVSIMSKLGEGDSTRDLNRNFGIGIRMACIATGAELEIVTRPARSPNRNQGHRVVLSKVGPRQWGLKELGNGELVEDVNTDPKSSYSTWATIGMPYSAADIVMYLNQRYLELPAAVRVKDGHEQRQVVGLKALLGKVCQLTGSAQYKNATLLWGIRSTDTPAVRQILETEWEAPSLSIAWGTETVRKYTRGNSRVLQAYGVEAGDRETIFVVVATNPDVLPTPDRCDLSNFDELKVQDEIAAKLPDEIRAHMSVYESKFFDINSKDDEAQVIAMLNEFATNLSSPTLETSATSGSGSSSGGGGSSGGGNSTGSNNPGDKAGDATKRRRRQWAQWRFVDGTAVPGPVQYNDRTQMILINKDHEHISRLIEQGKTAVDRQKIRNIIAAQVVLAWRMWFANGRAPTDDDLATAAMTNLAIVLKSYKRFPITKAQR